MQDELTNFLFCGLSPRPLPFLSLCSPCATLDSSSSFAFLPLPPPRELGEMPLPIEGEAAERERERELLVLSFRCSPLSLSPIAPNSGSLLWRAKQLLAHEEEGLGGGGQQESLFLREKHVALVPSSSPVPLLRPFLLAVILFLLMRCETNVRPERHMIDANGLLFLLRPLLCPALFHCLNCAKISTFLPHLSDSLERERYRERGGKKR